MTKKGHEVTIINVATISEEPSKMTTYGIQVYFLRNKTGFFNYFIEEFNSSKNLKNIIEPLGLDILICISEWAVRYCYYLKKHMPNLKMILWLQDFRTPQDWKKNLSLKEERQSSVFSRNSFIFWIRLKFNLYTIKKGISSVDLLLTQTDLIKDKLREIYNLNTDNILLLSNPIEIPLKIPLKYKKPTIVFLGRLDAVKRPWIFFEIAKKFPDYDFKVLGKSHFPEIMNSYIDKCKEVKNLHFCGLVEGERKKDILSKSWILINTSVYESLPVSFLEALSYKMPILSCHNPDNITKSYGYYTRNPEGEGYQEVDNFANGLKYLLENNRWKKLGEKGYKFVKNFSDENKVIERLIHLIEDLKQTKNSI